MKRTYIANISHSEELEALPIFPKLLQHWGENDETSVLIIKSDGGEVQGNDMILSKLSEAGIRKSQVKIITTEKNRDSSFLLGLMRRITDEILDESQVYADITSASSLVSSIMMYAMNVVEKIKDCEVEGIFCKETAGEDTCDLTVVKLLGDIAEQMKALGICRVKEGMERIFLKRDSGLEGY